MSKDQASRPIDLGPAGGGKTKDFPNTKDFPPSIPMIPAMLLPNLLPQPKPMPGGPLIDPDVPSQDVIFSCKFPEPETKCKLSPFLVSVISSRNWGAGKY